MTYLHQPHLHCQCGDYCCTQHGSIFEVETGDLACAFTQADSSCEMFSRPPKGLERDRWIWRLHGAMNGMRTASRDFTEFLAGVLTNTGFKRGKLE